MAVFEDCSVVLDLKNVPFKERRRLMTAISDNGGDIAYVVNQKCSFVVASSVETLSSSKLRSAQKHQVPVVGVDYVWSCLEQGILLPATEHVIKPTPPEIKSEILTYPGVKTTELESRVHLQFNQEETKTQFPGTYLGSFRLYKDNDRDLPDFPSSFQVAKYTIFSKTSPKTWSVLELQSAKVEAGRQYRVVKSIMRELENTIVHDAQAHSSRSEEAVEVYLMLKKQLQDEGFTETHTLPPEAEKLASPGLQQLLLEEKLNCSTVSHEVGVFVELIWKEALGSLNSILTVPITSISLNDVSRVEGLLLQVQKSQFGEKTKDLLEEVNRLLPLRMEETESQQKLVSQKLDLCQLIRDILTISEATLGNPYPSSLGKYRALQCSIEQVPSQSPEFQTVCQLLKDKPVEIQKVLRVNRGAELHMFKEELGNIKHLLHSTRPSSCVGILSRGLLLPRVGVEQHGIERTDIGNLGGGIYFSDSLITSLKYSKPSVTDGSRLLLVCDVALGQCKDVLKRDTTLTCAPEGYNSVHGVSRTQKAHSEFEDDEYVVYSTDQVKLKYVVQYFLEEDQVKTFEPDVNTSADTVPFFTTSDLLSVTDTESLEVTKNPLEEVTAGLLDSSGQKLPLQAVHVRCKLMDLLSQVVIFQTYTNKSIVPIEAKYVFPLEETAAVCGFEAFINGKHIIGKVKEKETARKEYRQAIEKGHGAYLMDQDAPDVFTISVGNLPPGATVLIKVTFITELVVRAGTILFSLPGSVAPWQQSAALNQTTQTTVEKVGMTELQSEGEFSLCMSIEMPYGIMDLECSHRFKIKRTECKAVVSTLPDQTLGTDGFQLSFSLSEIHMPRMWVEKHPEKDSEACMLVFYPDFESSGVSSSAVSDVVILLDASESMRGQPLLNARRIALEVLRSMDRSLRVNVVFFGTDYKEAFPSLNIIEEAFEPAKKFIMTSPAVGGSTELWRPLRSLNLLPPSQGVRNVLLLSDGHVQNQPQTLQLVRDNVQHTRLFTCGLSPTANRHMLRALAQAGGGSHEFFDTKSKHTWSEKVKSLVRLMASPGCSSVAVKWQQFNPTAPLPVQAPSQLHALFNDCHTLIYGFVPHCTQATLFGDLSGQEIKTMVSTTELQKTKGTFLHKLTARAIIRDYEDGNLSLSEAEHEEKKAELKSFIIDLSKEFSILSQFTSFVAIEERDQEQPDLGFTDVPKLIAEEDVDILPYMDWDEEKQKSSVWDEEIDEYSYMDDSEAVCFDQSSSSEDMDFGASIDCVSPSFSKRYSSKEYRIGSALLTSEDIFDFTSKKLKRTQIPQSSQAAEYTEIIGFKAVNLSCELESASLMAHRTRDEESVCQDKPAPVFGSGFHKLVFSSSEPHSFGSSSRPSPSAALQSAHPHIQPVADKAAYPSFFKQSLSLFAPKDALLSSITPPPPPPACLACPPPPARPAAAPLILTDAPVNLSYCVPSPRSSVITAHDAPCAPVLQSAATFQSDFRLFPCNAFSISPPPAAKAAPPPPPPSGRLLIPASADTYDADCPYMLNELVAVSSESSILPLHPPPPPPPPVLPGLLSPLLSDVFSSAASLITPPPAVLPPPTSVIPLKKSLRLPSRGGISFRDGHPPPRRYCVSSSSTLPSAPKGLEVEVFCYQTKPPSSSPGLFPIQRQKSTQRSERAMGFLRGTQKASKIMQTDKINWDELFDLQQQEGYWECTGALSRFLGLDVDFFANVFLKEKGICSLGMKAHTDILRLVATLLVLQLIRVMKLVEGKLLQSLFHLTDSAQPRPVRWEAVKRAVDWACWADRQYPCVYSRLEFGWNWESCTRQLLGLDSLPPCSALAPVLQRSTGLSAM